MKRFLGKFKQISIVDIGHLFLFVLAIIPGSILRQKRSGMWLICEYGQEARDNGYWFYKFVQEKHPEQDIVYAIDSDAEDYQKVKALGECIPYGSFKHWVYYLAAQVNLSSHKGGKPNAAVCYFLEVYGIIKNSRVFLQHGITKDLAELFFYENTKMRLFICGAYPEYEFVKKEFGYPADYVKYTGFARFDSLLAETERKNQILIAPTWRSWLYQTSSNPYENTSKGLDTSEYFQTWKSFLENAKLRERLVKDDVEIVFFPHRNMGTLFEAIKSHSHIRITDWRKDDLQILMKESACMITDYSSTAMDFAYMNKPVIYYHFDYERYRQEHFKEGYFSYERDGFGRVCYEEEALLIETEKLIMNKFGVEKLYLERIERFFPLRDRKNCERIYQEIKSIV